MFRLVPLLPAGSLVVLVQLLSAPMVFAGTVNDYFTVAENSKSNAIVVLANDSDPDGIDWTTVSITQCPENGTIDSIGTDNSPNNIGHVYYTPDSNFWNFDVFTYQVDDDLGNTLSNATVYIMVTSDGVPLDADFDWYPFAGLAFQFVDISEELRWQLGGFAAANPSGCRPQQRILSGNFWSWDFDDTASGGANTSTERNPLHNFSSPGVYRVTQGVDNSGGSEADQAEHLVHVVSASTKGYFQNDSILTMKLLAVLSPACDVPRSVSKTIRDSVVMIMRFDLKPTGYFERIERIVLRSRNTFGSSVSRIAIYRESGNAQSVVHQGSFNPLSDTKLAETFAPGPFVWGAGSGQSVTFDRPPTAGTSWDIGIAASNSNTAVFYVVIDGNLAIDENWDGASLGVALDGIEGITTNLRGIGPRSAVNGTPVVMTNGTGAYGAGCLLQPYQFESSLFDITDAIDSTWYQWIDVYPFDTVSIGDSIRVRLTVKPGSVPAMKDGFPKVFLPDIGENPGQMVRDTSANLGMLDTTLFAYPGRVSDPSGAWLEITPENLFMAGGSYPIIVETRYALDTNWFDCDTVYIQEPIDTRIPPPDIADIFDVPADQGGYATIRWRRSPADLTGASYISEYSIWRATPWDGSKSTGGAGTWKAGVTVASRNVASRTVSSALGEFAWEQVGLVTPHDFEFYAFTAPTLYDSTALNDGKHYFLVSAHSTDGVTFWDSDPDSGYSVDNLAPPAPFLLFVSTSETAATVTWRSSLAPDVSNYKVYRDTVPGVAAEISNLIATPSDTTFTDVDIVTGSEYFYRVSGVDFSGNEGGLSNELSASTCECDCHGDFACNGVVNVFDVVATIDIAFRGNAPTPDPNASCPYFPMDVNCDGVINVFDVVKTVNVAFRGANVATEFCGPCL